MDQKINRLVLIIISLILFVFSFSFFPKNSVYAILEPTLVKDINKVPYGDIKYLTSLNDEIFFKDIVITRVMNYGRVMEQRKEQLLLKT